MDARHGPERFDSARLQSMKPLPSIFIALLLAASGPAAPAQETNPAARLDYNAFKIIAEKNIFDPTRRGRRIPGPNVRQRVVEHLTFSGVGDDYGKTRFREGAQNRPNQPGRRPVD